MIRRGLLLSFALCLSHLRDANTFSIAYTTPVRRPVSLFHRGVLLRASPPPTTRSSVTSTTSSTTITSSTTTTTTPTTPLDFDTLTYLLGAAALWGTYPTLVKLLYASGPALDPSIVVLLRFFIMAAVGVGTLVATTPKYTLLRRYVRAERAADALTWSEQVERCVPGSVYLAALELGLLGGLGTYFQTLSLSSIPALTAAVLYSTVNVFTPLLASLFGADDRERAVSFRTWAGCLVGLLASAWALVPDTAPPGFVGDEGGGAAAAAAGWEALVDSLPQLTLTGGAPVMLLASGCYAATKVRLSSHLRYHSAEEMATGRLVAQAGGAAAGLGLLDETSAVHELLPEQAGGLGESLADVAGEVSAWAAAVTLAASALLSGAGATFLQSLGQRRASAPQAQLWFALTPAFGATWAYLVLGEQCTFHQVTGAALLLGAIALSVPALESPPGSSGMASGAASGPSDVGAQ